MIKLLLGNSTNQNHVLLLGLTRENLDQLMLGHPVLVPLGREFGIPDGYKLAICFGETQSDIIRDVKEQLGVEIPFDRESGPAPGEEFRWQTNRPAGG